MNNDHRAAATPAAITPAAATNNVQRGVSNSKSTPTPTHPQATIEMCLLCFDVLLLKLHQRSQGLFTAAANQNLLSGMPTFTDPILSHVSCPLFVTWDIWNPRGNNNNKNNNPWELRGCIGSLQPLKLDRAIAKYALTSALHDSRFAPIAPPEIHALRVKVSLLIAYEPCAHVHDWNVGVHGIMIEWTGDEQQQQQQQQQAFPEQNNLSRRRYSATYLPEVAAEQGWTVQQAVESLIRKAGYQGVISAALLKQICCTRYQSSKMAVDFRHYCAVRQEQFNYITTATTTTTSTMMQMQSHPESPPAEAYQLAVAAAAAANGGNKGGGGGGGTATGNCQIM